MTEHSKTDASESLVSDVVVPDDFPRNFCPAAFGGAQGIRVMDLAS
jgi:hypothetical protein